MATLTKIVTGMEKGPEAIDANFEALNKDSIVKTPWSNTGVTMLNGFAPANSEGMIWNTVKFGETTLLTIKGSINYPALTKGQALPCLQIPTSVFPVNGDFAFLQNTVLLWGDQIMALNFDSATGKVTFTNESIRGDGTMPAGTKFISLSMLF